MASAAVRRILFLFPLLLIVSIVVFGLLLLIPGDPASAILGDQATPQQIETTRERLGLNDPIPLRYAKWLGNAARGDLGTSLFNSYPVRKAITDRLPVTLSLVGMSLFLAVITGIPAGIIAGAKRGSFIDRALTLGTAAGVAFPNFWLGIVLSLFIGVKAGWLPATGYVPISENPSEWLQHILLPAITLAAATSAELVRQMRAAMIDVLEQDYIRTARSKGLSEFRVVSGHALKNALIPVATVAGLSVSRTFGLSVIVEQIFALNGVGSLALHAVFDRDIPLIQGIVLMAATVVLLTNLTVDLSYLYLNPATRER